MTGDLKRAEKDVCLLQRLIWVSDVEEFEFGRALLGFTMFVFLPPVGVATARIALVTQ